MATHKYKEKNWSNKWLKTNEVTSKNIAKCTKVLEYRNYEKELYKVKCDWESQIKKKGEQRNTVIATNRLADCTYMNTQCNGHCSKTGDSSNRTVQT